MISPSSRKDLVERLRYTFITAEYPEIDDLIAGLSKKANFEELCEEFFVGCRIDSKGYLTPGGFFSDVEGSFSLLYAMYELLGLSPDTFLLKHRVTRVKFLRKELSGSFRLPRGLFLIPNLEVLVIRGIGITRLPDSVSSARGLRVLDFAGNRISAFPDTILKLPKLTALNLAYNRLEALPKSLGRLRKLRILNLRGNELTKLPAEWHRLQNLRSLDLSMNRITDVPDSLGTLTSLEKLRLEYNDLEASVEARWESEAADGFGGENRQGSLGIG
jgi:Leucine-rich repeat (LRR) protein